MTVKVTPTVAPPALGDGVSGSPFWPPLGIAGNRISLARLRGFAETRDSDFCISRGGITRAIGLIWNDLVKLAIAFIEGGSIEGGRGDDRDG